jgi:hypothetical protein
LVALFAAMVVSVAGLAAVASEQVSFADAPPVSACNLGNLIQHVIHITFDNVHFFRDNPNVPSDLELMPHLKQFLESNGTILSNMHTPLIAHTAEDSLAIYTGLYGDRHGMPVSNSYKSFHPDGSTEPDGSFVYWTSPVFNTVTKSASTTDTSPSMVYSPVVPAKGQPAQTVTPAPWVPFTRAGCTVGDWSTANMVLENLNPDIPSVFGPGSPEVMQLASDPSGSKDPETADYAGMAVHCASGDAICATAQGVKFGQSSPSPTAITDSLPDEPGGYSGYQALIGFRYGAPQLGAGTPSLARHGYAVTNAAGHLVDLNGNEIQNPFTHAPGFTGFSPVAAQSLAMIADMQEAGIPVTYGYIADLHERKAGTSGCSTATATGTGFALGPGDSCYVHNAQAYDAAFATFLNRLAADGITPANTLFEIGAEENDHFAGANAGRTVQPTPANCDGVTVACTYASGQIGELSANLPGLLATQTGNTTAFDVEPQGAAVYVHGQPAGDDPATRQLERDVAQITANNPFSGVSNEKIVNYQAGALEQRVLHLETADPLRTPTFTVFPKGDYFFSQGAQNCTSPCVSLFPRFAWDHGYYAPDIDNTWSALVGPGVAARGIDGPQPADSPAVSHPNGDGTVPQLSTLGTWADETDIRPTLLALAGLRDDYRTDGIVLTQILTQMPKPLAGTAGLAECYKQLNASVGEFATNTLLGETAALASGTSTADDTYTQFETKLSDLANTRDALANQIKQTLSAAAFDNTTPNRSTIQTQHTQCEALLTTAATLTP